MPKLPAIQFYTGDWLKDPSLSKCSPATRGIWMDAICAMHESDRRGILTGNADQLSRVLRCGPADVTRAVRELADTGTANVEESNGVVTLINRRMHSAFEERLATLNRVRKHRGQDPVTSNVTPEKPPSNAPSSSSSSTSVTPDAAHPAGGVKPARRVRGSEPPEGKFPPGVWQRAREGWANAFRHVHGSEFRWDSQQHSGLSKILTALDGDLAQFERVAKAWLKEPEQAQSKGHPLWVLAKDLNYIESKIAKGTVGHGTAKPTAAERGEFAEEQRGLPTKRRPVVAHDNGIAIA